MKNHTTDELLEAIWRNRELGQSSVSACLESAHAEADLTDIEKLESDGLITISGEDIHLTGEGEKLASGVIRRHRIAERLFTDVLGVGQEQSELAACTFEHTVVPEVVESLCTLLGHPRECPHGKPIPPGECCKEGRIKVGPALSPLSEIPCGQIVKVAYIRPEHQDRLHMLLSMGIGPGASVRVNQRTPVLVLYVDESEFAMDRQIAEDIYVWVEAGQ